MTKRNPVKLDTCWSYYITLFHDSWVVWKYTLSPFKVQCPRYISFSYIKSLSSTTTLLLYTCRPNKNASPQCILGAICTLKQHYTVITCILIYKKIHSINVHPYSCKDRTSFCWYYDWESLQNNLSRKLALCSFIWTENTGKGRKVKGRAVRIIRIVIIINSQFKLFRTPFTENWYKRNNCVRWD